MSSGNRGDIRMKQSLFKRIVERFKQAVRKKKVGVVPPPDTGIRLLSTVLAL